MRVLQVGGGAAGPLLGRLLADQGATVAVLPEPADLPLPWEGFDQDKARVQGPIEAWLPRTDVLIDGGVVPVAAEVHPATIHCRIEGGEGLPPVEGPVGARTGLYEVPLGRVPRPHGLPIATTVGALWGAVGVGAALVARARDGRGQRVQLSLVDAAVATHELLALATDRPPTAWNPLHWAGSPFIGAYAAAQGAVYVHLGLAPHLGRFLDHLGSEGQALRAVISPRTLRDPGAVASVREARRIRAALQALFATRPASAWEQALGQAGCCAVQVRSPEAWAASPQAQAAGLVTERGPGPAVRVQLESDAPAALASPDTVLGPEAWPRLAEPRGDDRRPPLDGIDVLDLSQVIAGPVAGRTLAELGARVVRVDNPWFRPAFVDAFHAVFDRGKQGVWIDLAQPGGQAELDRLVAALRPAVLVENFRPGKASALGLDRVPARVRLSLSAYGPQGPWGAWGGWEQTAQAACGVQADYGRGRPELFPSPVHDLGTGLLGAFGVLCALHAGGGRAETSLAATSTWLQAARLFGGQAPAGGWSSRGGWSWRWGGLIVPRVRPSEALARSGRVRRGRLAGVGELTLIDGPLRFERSAEVLGQPSPRGADTAAWLGRARDPEPSVAPSRARWWASRVKWAIWAALTR